MINEKTNDYFGIIEEQLSAAIPKITLEGLKRYRDHKIRTGSFLECVLKNDLFAACAKADTENRVALWDIAHYIFNTFPRMAYGSPEAVESWLKKN